MNVTFSLSLWTRDHCVEDKCYLDQQAQHYYLSSLQDNCLLAFQRMRGD